MRCINCDACIKGYHKDEPEKYFCIGVKEPFEIQDVNGKCSEYKDQHKYLNELSEKYTNLNLDLYPFDSPNKKRYADQIKEYGFDIRETFILDITLVIWLYERLKYLIEVGGKIVDFSASDALIFGEVKTTLEWIKIMIKDCERIIVATSKEVEVRLEDIISFNNYISDIYFHLFHIFINVRGHLGW